MPRQPDLPMDKYIGGRVRARRLELGMSQERLADTCDLTFQQIQKYEKGMNRISGSRLCVMARVLDVPITYFFEGGPSYTASAKNRAANGASALFLTVMTTKDGQELIGNWMKIKSKAARQQVVDLTRTFASLNGGI